MPVLDGPGTRPAVSVLAGLQNRGEFDELGLMLVGMVLAEEELGTGRQLGANAGSGSAAITPVRSRELGTCQSCSHGLSVLAYLHCVRRMGL